MSDGTDLGGRMMQLLALAEQQGGVMAQQARDRDAARADRDQARSERDAARSERDAARAFATTLAEQLHYLAKEYGETLAVLRGGADLAGTIDLIAQAQLAKRGWDQQVKDEQKAAAEGV